MKDKLIKWIVALIARFWGNKLPAAVKTALNSFDEELDKLKARDDLKKLGQKTAVTSVKEGMKRLEEKSRRIAAQAHRR